ncbi:MucBP domain-containing protein, partial [Weissella kandleri]|uniref:MucBP domain-containing protein n=1 Tax=Weissella kandleri TaxID=1616 RepID=UPI00387EAA4A
MKIGKYLLISTAVLGLVNPLAVLADEQTSNSSSRNSDTSINSSADSDKTSKLSEVSTKSEPKVTTASESIPWGDSGFNLTLENGILHLPSASFNTGKPNITLQAALENANVGRNEVFKIVIDGPLEIADGRMVFADLSNLESIDGLENLDTSQVTDMTSMFYNTGLINLDLSNFNTSKVTNMYGMFMNMKKLESVNVSSFDTSNVVTMERMFGNVRDTDTNQLLSLDLSNFDTSKVSTMTDMFKGANSLKELKLGDNFRFKNGSRLLDPERTGQYSGKWQNVGQGTKDNPTGKNEWSTVELTNNYGSGDADTYVWQPRSSTHTVKFYEANGNELPQNKISVSGRIGQEYDLTDEVNLELARLRSDGYKVVSNYGSIKGVFKEIHDGAGYILTKAPEIGVGNVTARYIDENGNDIAKPDFKTGRVGTEFKTTKKDIKGYTFQKVEGLEIGKFSSQNKIVTYIYSKDIVKAADVTVKYVDENGKEIAKSEVKSGNVGDKYTTEKKDITGYTFKEVKGSANGEFT